MKKEKKDDLNSAQPPGGFVGGSGFLLRYHWYATLAVSGPTHFLIGFSWDGEIAAKEGCTSKAEVSRHTSHTKKPRKAFRSSCNVCQQF